MNYNNNVTNNKKKSDTEEKKYKADEKKSETIFKLFKFEELSTQQSNNLKKIIKYDDIEGFLKQIINILKTGCYGGVKLKNKDFTKFKALPGRWYKLSSVSKLLSPYDSDIWGTFADILKIIIDNSSDATEDSKDVILIKVSNDVPVGLKYNESKKPDDENIKIIKFKLDNYQIQQLGEEGYRERCILYNEIGEYLKTKTGTWVKIIDVSCNIKKTDFMQTLLGMIQVQNIKEGSVDIYDHDIYEETEIKEILIRMDNNTPLELRYNERYWEDVNLDMSIKKYIEEQDREIADLKNYIDILEKTLSAELNRNIVYKVIKSLYNGLKWCLDSVKTWWNTLD